MSIQETLQGKPRSTDLQSSMSINIWCLKRHLCIKRPLIVATVMVQGGSPLQV